ncbi:MAG: PAS domain S-box protein [Chlamydiota bacterium]|nr:PAS domain S-box protein [Chlamydiota bacterium]
MKNMTLIRRFSLWFLIALLFFSTVVGWIAGTFVEHIVMQESNRRTIEIVSKNVLDHFVPDDFRFPNHASTYEKLSEKVKHLSLGPDIVPIIIWNKDKAVVWSNAEKMVGKVFSDNKALSKALAGETVFATGSAQKTEYEVDHPFRRIQKIYVPIIFKPQDGIDIVFQIQQNLDALYDDIYSHQKTIWTTVLGGFIFLYLTVFAIILRASRRIEKHDEELAESEEKYRTLFQSVKDAIITADHKGTIIFHNKAAAQLFDYTSKELTGKPVSSIMPEGYNQAPSENFNKHVKSKGAEIIEKTFEGEGQTKNGALIPIEVSLSAFKRKGTWTFTSIIRDITERKHAEEARQRSHQHQELLNELLQISLKDISLKDMLSQSLDLITTVPYLALEGKASVYLMEDNVLVMKAQKGLTEPIPPPCRRMELGQCISGLTATSGEIVFADGNDALHEIECEGISSHGHCCVPIISDGNVLGMINLYFKEGQKRHEKEEEFLQAAANVMIQMIHSKILDEKLQHTATNLREAMGGTIQLLSATVEMRDPYTAGHQKRVADLARAIATEMGLSSGIVDGLRLGALIHDIGKISVPAEILSKPGKITPIEFALIKSHAEVGYNLLKKVEFPWPVAEMVFQHHEKMDGSGYPQGISGEEICIEARILCVADVVEAIASQRPYRPALGIDVALEEIEKQKGILYDSKSVEACLKIFKEKGYEMKL